MSNNHDDGKTNILPDLENRLAGLPNLSTGTGSLVGKREVLLIIEDKVERVLLEENMHCLLGRFSQTKPSAEAIDLSPYDAQEQGVSRIHAQIYLEDSRLYLSDLDSSNGTFIGSEKLNPHKPTQVYNGEQIQLGRLPMQIVFK
ncbi:MAG: FHA domain-containing protein [Anaerolineae bacterium]|nr:FHA domain-containing protein [Anaerolineae bacterium]MDQ7034698.1 FHA domain-containing protein [Anaerolineae bacterium]